MKKILFILFVAAVALTSCQKDTGTNVTITANDLVSISSQLKGTWVYPSQNIKYVDGSGKSVLPTQNLAGAAFEFDGDSKVNIITDLKTTLKGTYKLSSQKGQIYLTVTYPDATSTKYQVLQADNQTLKLLSNQAYTYFDNSGNQADATAVTNTTLSRQNGADRTGSLIRVMAGSDSTFNVSVYVIHKSADTSSMLDSKQGLINNYSFQFAAKPGDQLAVTMLGNATGTYFNAYYNGIPMSGAIDVQGNQLQTSSGWQVQ